MLVGKSDRARDLDAMSLGVAHQLVGDLLHGVEPIAAEGNTGLLELLILNALLLILVSHYIN